MAEKNYFRNKFSPEFYKEFQKARFSQLILCKELPIFVVLLLTGLIFPYLVICFFIRDLPFSSTIFLFKKLLSLFHLSNKAFEYQFSYAMVNLSSTAYVEGDDCIPILPNLYYLFFLKSSEFKKANEYFLQDLKNFAKKEKSLPFGKFALLGDQAAFCPNKEFYQNK